MKLKDMLREPDPAKLKLVTDRLIEACKGLTTSVTINGDVCIHIPIIGGMQFFHVYCLEEGYCFDTEEQPQSLSVTLDIIVSWVKKLKMGAKDES